MKRRIMTRSVRRIAAKGTTAILLAVGVMAIMAVGASASKPKLVYKNMPGKKIKDTESECMNGCGHLAFGNEIDLAGVQRYITSVTAELSSFSCEYGIYNDNTCETEPGTTFTELAVLKLYEPVMGEPGPLIGEKRILVNVPYKPEPNIHGCVNHGEGSGWGPECHIGDLVRAKFTEIGQVFVANSRVILEVELPEDESTEAGKLNKSGDPHSVNVATATVFNGVRYEYEPVPKPTKGSDPREPEVIFATAEHPDGEWVASTEEAPGSAPAFEVKAKTKS